MHVPHTQLQLQSPCSTVTWQTIDASTRVSLVQVVLQLGYFAHELVNVLGGKQKVLFLVLVTHCGPALRMQASLVRFEATLRARCFRQAHAIVDLHGNGNAHGRGRVQVLASGTSRQTTDAAAKGSSVVIFTTTGCPYCQKAKQTLMSRDVPYQVLVTTANYPMPSAANAMSVVH